MENSSVTNLRAGACSEKQYFLHIAAKLKKPKKHVDFSLPLRQSVLNNTLTKLQLLKISKTLILAFEANSALSCQIALFL